MGLLFFCGVCGDFFCKIEMRSKTFCVLSFYRIRYELLLQDRDEGRGFIILLFCGISAECCVLTGYWKTLRRLLLCSPCLRDKWEDGYRKSLPNGEVSANI